MLALSFEMGMDVHFVAPAFGFQKNIPYPDNDQLRKMVEPIWSVCQSFGVSIGFHSGSGKSAENYRVVGEVTGSNLEIKTSGRYTYEMGVALSRSKDPNDQALWKDWYAFTVELASNGCFAEDETERNMAREFVRLTIGDKADEAFESELSCRTILGALEPSPEHFFWFEYNFLYASCCGRQLAKEIIGRPLGGRISSTQPVLLNQRRGPPPLRPKSRGVYSVLGGATGIASSETCDRAREELQSISTFENFIGSISGIELIGGGVRRRGECVNPFFNTMKSSRLPFVYFRVLIKRSGRPWIVGSEP